MYALPCVPSRRSGGGGRLSRSSDVPAHHFIHVAVQEAVKSVQEVRQGRVQRFHRDWKQLHGVIVAAAVDCTSLDTLVSTIRPQLQLGMAPMPPCHCRDRVRGGRGVSGVIPQDFNAQLKHV